MKKDELMTIEELSLNATELSKKNISEDKRYSSEITPRRIRDYIAKGLLDKPLKEGKTPLFTQSHLNKLLKLREMQSDGLSEQYIKKLSDNYFENNPQDEQLKNEAMATINNLVSGNSTNIFYQNNNKELNHDLNVKSLINSTQYSNEVVKSSKLNGITGMTQTSKMWQEFPVDEEGKVFLKIEYGSLPKNSEQILQNIKDLLNIK